MPRPRKFFSSPTTPVDSTVSDLTSDNPPNPQIDENKEDSYLIPAPIVDRVSLLFRAIEAHDESSVRSMMTCYEELDPKAELPGLPMPLLHLAVGLSENHPEIVLFLLEKGGDPNQSTTDEKVSPMHLSVIYDYDNVLKVLMQFGGNPTLLNGDNKSCYDIAKDNVEEEMREKCFLHFYRRSMAFRQSIKPSDSIAKVWRNTHSQSLSLTNLSSSDQSSDCFVSCESDFEPSSVVVRSEGNSSINQSKGEPDSLWNKYVYLMTEDESDDCGKDGRLSTIEEESALSASYQKQLGYEETTLPELPEMVNELSESSSGTTDPSCANSTPPVLPEPTMKDLKELETAMKKVCKSPTIPVTPSTFPVLNRFALQEQAKLAEITAPKKGTQNFCSELKLARQNLHLLDEWGNLKIELLQSLSTPSKKSKSFYNYLLLDPKVLKRVNFSGSHLKSDIIKNADKFEAFLTSIFYIGKGCGKRPIQHLVDAKLKFGSGKKSLGSCGEKVDKILEIWKTGLGVIVVSVFHYSSEKEANVNEASMIDAVGLIELSNIKKGSYAGSIATSWSQKSKNQFGSFLLYKSFCTFAVSEHKSFYPQDI